MKTLFEELEAWRGILADVLKTEVEAIETELLGPHRDWHRGREAAIRAALLQLDGILDEHRESERWHYPAEGEVPECPITEVYCVWEGNAVDGVTISGVATFADGDWMALMPQGEQERSAPTRWRYLSPGDVPEGPDERFAKPAARRGSQCGACRDGNCAACSGWCFCQNCADAPNKETP